MKGVQPAQWEQRPDLALRASPIDGSGAQSMLFASRSGRSGLFAGLLLKQGFGIRDAWCHRDTPRREIASMVAEVQRKVVVPEVERSYIDLAVQHGIALGVAANNLPDPALLEIAEAVNGADWKDRRIDAAAETERLFAELPADTTQRRSDYRVAATQRGVDAQRCLVGFLVRGRCRGAPGDRGGTATRCRQPPRKGCWRMCWTSGATNGPSGSC